MIMNYFSGIEWIAYNHIPSCVARIDKIFPDYYVINYAHRGELMWRMNGNSLVKLKGPVCWWTYPGPHFQFGSSGTGSWDHRFISFRGERVVDFIQKGLFDLNCKTPVKKIIEDDRFITSMDLLLKYLEEPIFGNNRAVNLLEELLLQIHEQQIEFALDSPQTEKISNLISSIRMHPENQWNFHECAGQIFISYSHFRRLFNILSGYPPNRFVIKRRIHKAAKLLRHTNKAIKEISYEVGYEDIYYFSKLFKQNMGIPPAYFRKESHLK